MRISGDPDDPHYVPLAQCSGAVVFYNGTPIRDCITADEERDWALCGVRDSKGNALIDWAAQAVQTREITGSIKVFIPQLTPANGFDAWMAERTNAAHAAYMVHNSAGGQAYR